MVIVNWDIVLFQSLKRKKMETSQSFFPFKCRKTALVAKEKLAKPVWLLYLVALSYLFICSNLCSTFG